MRLLNRYLCGQFLRFFALGFGGCTGLFLIVELFDRIDDFIERRVVWSDVMLYLLCKVPEIATQLVPAAFLLASVLTFSTLNKYNEITALRAAGIAPLRLAWPLLCLGALGCLGLLLAYEYLLPYTNQTYRLIWRSRIRHEQTTRPPGMVQSGQLWYRAGPRMWSIELSKPQEQRLLGVTIYEFDTDGNMRRRFDVAEAIWQPPGWLLRQGSMRAFTAYGTFAGSVEAFSERYMPFQERFADLVALRKAPDEMGLREMWSYIQRLQRQGLADVLYTVELHGKLAFTAVCMIMAGFGVPLAMRLNRSGGTMQAIGLTLFCGFMYWIFHSFAMALGKSGQLPPGLAAWSTNCCFGVGSMYLSYRLQ
jgi:lipopolysaccharide export system permease protein